jgi:uncharacterized C2H2 Zn-finger protein
MSADTSDVADLVGCEYCGRVFLTSEAYSGHLSGCTGNDEDGGRA